MIFISKSAGAVKIVNESGLEFLYIRSSLPTTIPVFKYNSNNTVDICIGDFVRNNQALSAMTIETVVPANKSQFYTQVALVFD